MVRKCEHFLLGCVLLIRKDCTKLDLIFVNNGTEERRCLFSDITYNLSKGKNMSNSNRNYLLLLTFLALAVSMSGCANDYSVFYKKVLDDAQISNLRILAPEEEPIIIASSDPERGIRDLYTKGYDLIGISSFNGKMRSDAQIISQAKIVGATCVLKSSKFLTSQAVSTPLILPNGFGGFNTTSMNNQQLRYDQFAAFMAKPIHQAKFGIRCKDMTAEQKKRLGRNTGLWVYTVVEGSPCYFANVMEDDILLAINDESVCSLNVNNLFCAAGSTGKPVRLTLYRGSEELEVVVNL